MCMGVCVCMLKSETQGTDPSCLIPDEYVQIVTDFGGKVEALRLKSRSTGVLRDVLLTDNGDEAAITANKFWKGMLLVPWANRVAYVGLSSLPYTCLLFYGFCIKGQLQPNIAYRVLTLPKYANELFI